MKTEWIKFTKLEDMPTERLLLCECVNFFKVKSYHTGLFTNNDDGHIFGCVGGALYFDRTITRYKDIQGLIPVDGE